MLKATQSSTLSGTGNAVVANLPGELKSSPLSFLADFSETAWNHNIKFYVFIRRIRVHFHAKQNFINFD